jgi:hypothetical protein
MYSFHPDLTADSTNLIAEANDLINADSSRKSATINEQTNEESINENDTNGLDQDDDLASANGSSKQVKDDSTTCTVDNQDPTISETCQLWSECTSIHGMYCAFNRTCFKPWKQITWAIATASLLWALVAEFRDFLQYNVDTTTCAVILPTLQFPRVTLCNSNSMFDPSMSSNETEPTNEAELSRVIGAFTTS